MLFVRLFCRAGAQSIGIPVGYVSQVACDNVPSGCGLGHRVLATHGGDPSPKSLSTLINLTEMNAHAPVGAQGQCDGLACEHGCDDDHFGVRHEYGCRLRTRCDRGACGVRSAAGGWEARRRGKVSD